MNDFTPKKETKQKREKKNVADVEEEKPSVVQAPIQDSGQTSPSGLSTRKKEVNVRWIDVSNLREPKMRLRSDLNITEEFRRSIREKGVIEPLVVRDRGGKFYEIICGNRRFAAAKLEGISHILCRVIRADDLEAAALAIIENNERNSTNKMDEAKYILTLISEKHTTQREIARHLSTNTKKSEATISKLLSVYSDEILRERVYSSKLTYTQALALLGRKPEEEVRLGHELGLQDWQTFVDENLGMSAKKIRASKSPDGTIQRPCFDCGTKFPEKSLKVIRLCTVCHARYSKGKEEGGNES
jgi:ParB family transcriptional regulator, chromosome partitioning protein